MMCDPNVIVEYYGYNFSCYEDANFATYNETSQDCDYLSTHAGIDAIHGEFSISPNPVKDQLSVHGVSKDCSYEIVSMNGESIRSGSFSGTEILDVSGLQKGMYLLRIERQGVFALPIKFVKE